MPLDYVCRDNAALRLEVAGLRRSVATGESGVGDDAGSGGRDSRLQKLEAENRDMKKTIDNLMEVLDPVGNARKD